MAARSILGKLLSPQGQVVLAIVCALGSQLWPLPFQEQLAAAIMGLFSSFLKLMSLPVLFLALLTSFTGVQEGEKFKRWAQQVVFWTFLTTLLAASVALILFCSIDPAGAGLPSMAVAKPSATGDFLAHLLGLVPANPFQPFIEGNVIGVLILAVALGLGLYSTPGRHRVHELLAPLLAAMLKIVSYIIKLVPLTVWAGIVLSFQQLQGGERMAQLGLYLGVVLGANLLQGFVVLPLLLWSRGLAAFRSMRLFMPALTVAFFSKSSVATIPVAICTAQERLKIDPALARFVFPICTSINMNGCAAFILVTTLFVAAAHGITFSLAAMIGWVLVATIAAIGNAGVPMGCYFLASAILAALDIPLDIMALILPVYALIDMVETALNVWSDLCVAMLVEQGRRAAS